MDLVILILSYGDCAWGNIMMDGRRLYPQGWHAQQWGSYLNGKPMRVADLSRTAFGGARYYFINLGISTKDQDEVLGIHGQELSPELSDTVPYNPYKLDVYILGMAYRHFLIEVPVREALSRRNFATLEQYRGSSFFTLSQRLYPAKEEPDSKLSRTLKDSSYRIRDFWWTATVSKKPPPPLS
ncbi:hypothetical protein FRC04_001194 [Tulasnella sp. 424]|nr:hypothetical protein FRC04_001194 [Tulasnella sp. 424]